MKEKKKEGEEEKIIAPSKIIRNNFYRIIAIKLKIILSVARSLENS